MQVHKFHINLPKRDDNNSPPALEHYGETQFNRKSNYSPGLEYGS